jgi:hypothetical protein
MFAALRYETRNCLGRMMDELNGRMIAIACGWSRSKPSMSCFR